VSFFEGLQADLSGGERKSPWLVRLFLALLGAVDRVRARFRRRG
jgi:hypothetical protein